MVSAVGRANGGSSGFWVDRVCPSSYKDTTPADVSSLLGKGVPAHHGGMENNSHTNPAGPFNNSYAVITEAVE